MPATATLTIDQQLDLTGISPLVDMSYDGQMVTMDRTYCTLAQYIAGPVPGKAYLKAFWDMDVQGPVTLNRYGDTGRPYGSRVKIYTPATTIGQADGLGDQILFLGTVMGRRDNGAKDEVQWVVHDDREVLSNLFVRGAIVAEKDGTPILNRRYKCRFNPEGKWNCTGGVIIGMYNMSDSETTDGVTTAKKHDITGDPAPVFAPYASMGRAYESPVEAFAVEELQVGKVIAWTARLALTYLCHLANIPCSFGTYRKTGDTVDNPKPIMDGIIPAQWRTLSNSKRLFWNPETIINLNGIDPANPTLPDMLDRKLPDLDISGMSFNMAIQKILEASGNTQAWWVGPQPRKENSVNTNMSTVQFFPIADNGSCGARVLKMQRGGNIESADTVHDYDVSEDASNVKPNVLVEAAPARAETSLEFDPRSVSVNGEVTTYDKSLLAAWTLTEQVRFNYIIQGGTSFTAEVDYCKVPPVVGDITTPYDKWELCDGKARTDGTFRPFCWARSNEAFALARSYYPTVYIAFRINPLHEDVIKALNGIPPVYDSNGNVITPPTTPTATNGMFSDRYIYPQMRCNRPVLPAQLTYMLFDPTGQEVETNFMLQKFPIRVMMASSDPLNPGYGDCIPTPNMQLTGDGTIWFRGVAEELDGGQVKADSWRCIYDGGLTGAVAPKPKWLKLNCAIPMDHRVDAYKVGTADQVLQKDYTDDIGGPPIMYVDNPTESFQEPHQVNSTPTNTAAMSIGKDSDGKPLQASMPFTRFAPPGSERPYAEAHAARKAMFSQKPERKSSWRLPWIRFEFPLGTWLEKVQVSGAPPLTADDGTVYTDLDYDIKAPVMQVTYDFNAQETTLSGVAGSL